MAISTRGKNREMNKSILRKCSGFGPVSGLGSVPGLVGQDPRFGHACLRLVVVCGPGLMKTQLSTRKIYTYLIHFRRSKREIQETRG